MDPDHPQTIVPIVRQTLATAGLLTSPVPAAPHFDGPALLTVRLAVTSGRVRDAMATGPELCHALARSGVRVYQDARGLVAIEVPKLAPARVPLSRMAPWQIGLTALGRPVEVDLSRESNAVFCGSTRSGKTTAMQVLALHAVRADARLVVADGKGRRWDTFAGSSALERAIGRGAEGSNAVLAWVLGEVDRRLAAGQTAPLLTVFADEAQEMDSATLGRIAARCLEAGVRIVAGYQEPRADQVDPLFSRQCGTRITGVLASGASSSRIVGTPDATLLRGQGDMLAVLDHAPAVRMGVAWAPADDPAWRMLDDGATAPKADAVEAPEPQQDTRYQKADDGPFIAWATGEWMRTGQVPSAYAMMTRFKLHPRRAGRVRDAVMSVSVTGEASRGGNMGAVIPFPVDGKVVSRVG